MQTNFKDLFSKIQSLNERKDFSLTTRAAITLNYRYNYGMNSPERNPNQKFSRAGYFLEVVATGAFVIASHINGFAGAPLEKFIPVFVNELGLYHRSKIELSPCASESLGDFKNLIIPFIPLIEDICSEKLRAIHGINSGTFHMAKNQDEIDFFGQADYLVNGSNNFGLEINSATFFSGEMKCWEHNFSGNDLNFP
jgi:hypothetical protein